MNGDFGTAPRGKREKIGHAIVVAVLIVRKALRSGLLEKNPSFFVLS